MSQRLCGLVLTLRCNFNVLRFSMLNATCITQYRSATFLEVLQQHGPIVGERDRCASAGSHPVAAWLALQRSRRFLDRQCRARSLTNPVKNFYLASSKQSGVNECAFW